MLNSLLIEEMGMSFFKSDEHEMIDCADAVRQSAINGVRYDIPEWLNAGF